MPDEKTPLSLIYLDVDDEITSAAARIRAAGADRVALVLPYGSRLATSRINFRLLAREATERGKHIEIICADASARALAVAAGLPTHPSVAAFEGRVPAGAATEPGAAREAAVGVAGAGVNDAPTTEPDVEGDTQTRVLPLPRRSSPRVPIVGPPRPPVRPRIAAALAAAVVVLVLLGGFLAIEFLPSATIVLHPRSEAIGPLQLTVEARPDVATADADALVIPAQRVPFNLEASDTFTATGVKVIETKATGNVTFSNFDTGRANEIPAGSIVKTPSGIEFATLATVTLPNATIKFPFTIVPSTSTVGVEAIVSGPGGNVGNNTITVVPKGENRRLMQVSNEQATTGGEERQATQVSADDVKQAQTTIETALATQLDEQLAAGAGVPPGLTMFPETAAVGEVTYTVDPSTLVGTEVATFDLAATAPGSAIGVDPTPIGAIAESRLEAKVLTGWTLASGGTAPTIGTPTAIGETVTYPVTISGAQVRDVDQAALLAAIKGLIIPEARNKLDDYGDVDITLWPDWVTKIPTRADRISFSLGEPQPSCDPVTGGAASGNLLGIDLGERRIGLAIAEADGLSARPLMTVNRARSLAPADDVATLARIVAEQRIGELVVGLPLEASGTHGRMAEAATTWARVVADTLGLPLTMRDERLSSHLAESRLGPMTRGRSGGAPSKTQRDRYRERVDREAAAIILQDELDARCDSGRRTG